MMETAVEISTLATRAKELRRLLGKSAETFADETGIPLNTLRTIEQGRTLNPGIKIIEQICTTYGVNEKWLIRNRGSVFDTPDKLETELNQAYQQRDQAFRQRDQAVALAADKEQLIQGLLRLNDTPQPTKSVRPGKREDVSIGSYGRRQTRNFSSFAHP